MPTQGRPDPAGTPEGRPGDDALPWTRNDALVAVGSAAVDLVAFGLGAHTLLGRVPAVGYVPLILSALPLLFRRRAPVAVLAAVLLLGLVQNLSVPMPQHFNAALVVALYTVARTRGPRVTAGASLASLVLPLVALSSWPLPSMPEMIGAVSAVALVVGTALLMNRWQRDNEAKRQLLADRAVAAERRRIARELHDIVAHHITTMQLMAGGARANLTAAPDQARDALVTLEGSGRMALREMRQLLDVLRAGDEAEEEPTAPQPGIADLERLVGESCRSGVPTEFEVRGEPRTVPSSAGLTVFRVVQEALTNARKYAAGARAVVRLTRPRRRDGGGGGRGAGRGLHRWLGIRSGRDAGAGRPARGNAGGGSVGRGRVPGAGPTAVAGERGGAAMRGALR
ncbi:histidine kinase [Streptomyces sp. RY43-2]|uniref:histidine kinase n=1 Tax=Streptomyces macrolidinus TaxID=2952607 RepID=A0ABT0ZL66_9ACTN|nr:histidine kinase [Streptomyces macrolidinus]MCN9244338.1 histidine kinase [Streptomyces macrolidinus]